jgi:subtilisin family serine protease
MKDLRLLLLGLMAFVCLAIGSSFAVVERTTTDGAERGLPASSENGYHSEMPNLWFVELSSAPLAEANPTNETKYLNKLKLEKQDFRSEARRRGVYFTERYAYDRLWNGLSVQVDPAQLLDLAGMSGVAGLYPVFAAEIPESVLPVDLENGAEMDLFNAIRMTGADQVQEEGITGAGVKVGVIDTGIDYTHPDLGGGFGPGFKVEGGYDLVGNAYSGPGTIPFPDPDPRDCVGHGTHVAGIIAANGRVRGVAPGAALRAYKVFGCSGGTGADVILAAMEAALQDGNQVINLSLGIPFQWPRYPTSRGADNLVNKGVVVVASAGNNGSDELYAIGAPAVGQKVIAVASVENVKVHALAAQIPGGPSVGYLPIGDTERPPLSGSALLKDIGHGCNADRVLFLGLQNRIAVAKRGRCGLAEIIFNARDNGARAVLIYNDRPGIFLAGLGFPGIDFPAATLSLETGTDLAARARFSTSLFWTDQTLEVPNTGGGTVSSFSSYGAGPDLDLKPDLAAPGGLIFSTLPLFKGGYGLASGTSMSSPHVTGTVALLLEAKPHTSAQAVRSLLQNTSVPRPWAENSAAGLLEPVAHQGAGMVDIHAAIQAQVSVTPGKLALGEMEGRSVTRQLTVENHGPTDLELDLLHQPALSIGPQVFDVQVAPGMAGVSFSPTTLRVGAGQSVTLDASFTQPEELPEGGLFGGYLVLSPRGGGREVRVPYLGMEGDYQKMVALNPDFTQFGNPLLLSGFEFGPNEPVTIVPARGEAASVVLHLEYPVRRLRVELFDALTGRSFGRIFEAGYFPRNSARDLFYSLTWQGHDSDGIAVPAGDYTLRFSIEKALGDDANPAHWEVWNSPAVTVIR